MVDAMRQALAFCEGRTRGDLDDDTMLEFALTRAIEIIGEAANKVSHETQASCPEVPWPSIVAMRNRIVHAYFDVSRDRLWETVQDDIPPLLDTLQGILGGKH